MFMLLEITESLDEFFALGGINRDTAHILHLEEFYPATEGGCTQKGIQRLNVATNPDEPKSL